MHEGLKYRERFCQQYYFKSLLDRTEVLSEILYGHSQTCSYHNALEPGSRCARHCTSEHFGIHATNFGPSALFLPDDPTMLTDTTRTRPEARSSTPGARRDGRASRQRNTLRLPILSPEGRGGSSDLRRFTVLALELRKGSNCQQNTPRRRGKRRSDQCLRLSDGLVPALLGRGQATS